MAKEYQIEVPALAMMAVTGVALVVVDTIHGHEWRMECDGAGRPLRITRDGESYPTLPNLLRPMHRFAQRFLAGVPS